MGIKYTYLTTQEIFEKISYISADNIIWLILLWAIVFGTFFFILYLFPIISLSCKHIIKQKNKAKRSLMIKQIAMQREIEEEIEKEL